MPRMNHRRPVTLARNLVCALTALTVATASCTSLHQVPVVRTIAGQPYWAVQAGDTVRVTLRDGASAQFTLQSVTPDAIIASDGTRFEISNITSVKRRAHSSNRTAALIVVGVLVIGLWAAAVASSDLYTFNWGRRAPDTMMTNETPCLMASWLEDEHPRRHLQLELPHRQRHVEWGVLSRAASARV